MRSIQHMYRTLLPFCLMALMLVCLSATSLADKKCPECGQVWPDNYIFCPTLHSGHKVRLVLIRHTLVPHKPTPKEIAAVSRRHPGIGHQIALHAPTKLRPRALPMNTPKTGGAQRQAITDMSATTDMLQELSQDAPSLSWVTSFVINRADVNAKNKDGKTALIRICEPNITHFNPNDPSQKVVMGPLAKVAKLPKDDLTGCVRLLLEHGAYVKAKDKDGATALYYAKTDEIITILRGTHTPMGQPTAPSKDGRN
jgi:hypothetical protein